MTRERAKEFIEEHLLTSLGKHAFGYLIYAETANIIIDEIYNDFEKELSDRQIKALALLKHLLKGYSVHQKDIEEAIAELEELQNRSCEGCKYDLSFAKPCHLCNRQTHLKDLFEPKDKE